MKGGDGMRPWASPFPTWGLSLSRIHSGGMADSADGRDLSTLDCSGGESVEVRC